MKRPPLKLVLLVLTLSMSLPNAAIGEWFCSDGRRCFTCEEPRPDSAHNPSDYCHRPANDLLAETDCGTCCRYVIRAEDRGQRNIAYSPNLHSAGDLPNPFPVVLSISPRFPFLINDPSGLNTGGIAHLSRGPPSFA